MPDETAVQEYCNEVNPPYSISSNNKSEHIQNLIKDYKKDLNEKKINLDDDYIKFIRFAEDMIAQNGEGVVAMITNNSFLDGNTHRQMRKHLLSTFDQIYILNLHGNSKRQETSPDGSKDENVFDIQQGVSINIFIKKATNKSTNKGSIFYADLYGQRRKKFDDLAKQQNWQLIEPKKPYLFFVPKDYSKEAKYLEYVPLDDLFNINSSGIETQNDRITIHISKKELKNILDDLGTLNLEEIRTKWSIKDGRDWKLRGVINDVRNNIGAVSKIQYRPFDFRYTYYSSKSKSFIAYPRASVMDNLAGYENIALLTTQKNRQLSKNYFFISGVIADRHALDTAGDSMGVFPLYVHHDDGTKTPNFKPNVLKEFTKNLTNYKPENIFDYIYAVLHSPGFQEDYKEFLKSEFPRVPKPKSDEHFRELTVHGKQLRELHLMTSPDLNKLITTFPIDGSDEVEKVKYDDDKVWINDMQYFGDVPEVAWNFYVGGYQPAQKWLKDRKGRKLSNADIEHYQKIIRAQAETVRTKIKIDDIL